MRDQLQLSDKFALIWARDRARSGLTTVWYYRYTMMRLTNSNTKQLNYYANPTLVDDTVIVHIGSNDITKFNYSKVDVEDLAQRIIDVGKKCKSYGVNNIAISSILVRKNYDVNEVIKKVNNLLKTLCLEQGFTFICNSAIAREMLWRDGLHLTNEGKNMLSNNFLQYLKNVPLGNDNRIFTD